MDTSSLVERKPDLPLTPFVQFLRELQSELKIDYEEGPWFAGGCALSLARGRYHLRSGSDIDIFFADEEQCNRIRVHFEERYGDSQFRPPTEETLEVKLEGEALEEFEAQNTPPKGFSDYTIHYGNETYRVQLIEFRFEESLSELLDHFDFTVSMFATDGYTIRAPEQAWIDLENGVLRLSSHFQARKTIKRLIKYSAMGFTLRPGSLMTLLKKMPRGFKFDEDSIALTYEDDDEEY